MNACSPSEVGGICGLGISCQPTVWGTGALVAENLEALRVWTFTLFAAHSLTCEPLSYTSCPGCRW